MKLLTVPDDYRFTCFDIDDLTYAAYCAGRARAFMMDAGLEDVGSPMFECDLDLAAGNIRDAAQAARRFLDRASVRTDPVSWQSGSGIGWK